MKMNMEKGEMKIKIKTVALIAIVAIFSTTLLGFGKNEAYAKAWTLSRSNDRGNCLTGGGRIDVVSKAKKNGKTVIRDIGDLGNFGQLGNENKYDEYSGGWACARWYETGNMWHGIMFIASSVEETGSGNNKQYKINVDVSVNLKSSNNTAIAMGMVHTGSNATNKAINIEYCTHYYANTGWCTDKTKGADGIISSYDKTVLRQNSRNRPTSSYSYWTPPIHALATSSEQSFITIDGPRLAEKMQETEFATKNVKYLDDGYTAIVLYQYRCWSKNGGTGECGVSPIVLILDTSGTADDPPSSTSCDSTNSYSNSGKSGVRKNGGSIAYTNNNSGTVSTWAKPGDSIQFTHTTCAAAQKLIDDNQAYLGSYDSNYTVSASTTNGTNGRGYIFGNDLSGNSSASIPSSTLKNNEYAYTANSPSDDAGSTYSCDGVYDGFISGHYQIPDLNIRSDKCGASRKTVASDAGNTITQTLAWRDFDIKWQTIYHDAEIDEAGNVIKPRTSENIPYVNSSTDYSTSASVYIPYNYILKPYIEGNKNDTGDKSQTATIGGKYDVTAYVPVDVRKNKQVGDTYATSTKDTKIKIVSFVLDSSSQPTSSVTYHANNGDAGASSICRYAAASGNVKHCANIADETITLNQNTSGNLSGTLGNEASISEGGSKLVLNDGIEASVPKNNISLGDKICVAVATWPSDSHNLGDAATVDSYDQSVALTNSAGSNAKWAVSAPSCATITKRPIFSVESSQLSATGTINSSTYTRDRLTFSSWAEYSIATSEENGVEDTASGAATAYIDALNLNYRYNPYEPKYAIASREVNLANTRAGTKSIRTFAAQTMLNSGNGSPGGATTLELAENIEKFYTSIENIYTRKGKTKTQSGAGIANFNDLSELKGSKKLTVKNNYYDLSIGSSYACVYDENKGYYVAYDSDATLGKDKKGNPTAPYYCLSNGSKYYHVENANAYIGGGGERNSGGYTQFRLTVNDLDGSGGQETFRNQTTVIHVEGTVVIDTNFVIAYNYGGRMLDYFTDIQQIPQVIIIADNIDITNNVSRIDAWLIAKNKINTCAYDNYSGFMKGNYISSAANGGLNANRCNKELVINGPVVANEITLNRTAGAGTTPAEYYSKKASLSVEDAYYAQRGEIFNLRSDAYLWGYYQAQRNGILTTVYSKELPTRY